jgi:S1-C subfamily serine protease
MRTVVLVYLLLPLALAHGAPGSCSLRVIAQLVDDSLNLKPVPKLKLSVTELAGNTKLPLTTGFDGTADIVLPCTAYSVASDAPAEFVGKLFRWDVRVTLRAESLTKLELSNDNAQVSSSAHDQPAIRTQDSLTSLFKKHQSSVLTVWSEIGQGTGFLVDERGLVVTNQHVVGPSEYIAVQIDESHKAAAVLLSADPEKDVAILWTDMRSLPGSTVAPMAAAGSGEPLAVEGERVFTIGSPMSRRKILTTGIVSKLETRAILSDININHGNSGGPLFNSLGFVVGITTFKESANGAGPSGIVRIEQVEEVLAHARLKMTGIAPPVARMLPVEPTDTFPLDAIKAAASSDHFDARPYIFSEGDYDVAIITPVLKYWNENRAQMEAVREKAKRTRHSNTAVQGTFRPLDHLRSWKEYAGEYQPVIQIQAAPKLRETFGSALVRSLTERNGVSTIPAKLRFKTDFYKMRLICGGREIEPIQPGKEAKTLNEKNYFVNVTDATYIGIYTYPYDAISQSCGRVVLELYSEKNPDSAKIRTLDRTTVDRVSADFAPYRKVIANAPAPVAVTARDLTRPVSNIVPANRPPLPAVDSRPEAGRAMPPQAASPAAVPADPATTQPAKVAMTNEDVIALKTAGFSDDFVISKIRGAAPGYKTDTSDVIMLKKANVSEAVIQAMIAAAPGPGLRPSTAPAADPAHKPQPAVPPATGVAHQTPAEKGSANVVEPAKKGIFTKLKGALSSSDELSSLTAPAPPPQPSVPPRAALTSITIVSKPAGATITIDGYVAGRTPAVVKLAPGTYKLTLKAEGFPAYSQQLTVEPGQVRSFGVALDGAK